MITGWGVHHIDIAHWGMNTELTGPIEVEATAEFPKKGLWNVHGNYEVSAKYANGVNMLMSSKNPNISQQVSFLRSRQRVPSSTSSPLSLF